MCGKNLNKNTRIVNIINHIQIIIAHEIMLLGIIKINGYQYSQIVINKSR